MEISIQYPSLRLRPYVEFYKTISRGNQVRSIPALTGYPGGFTDMVISLEGTPNIQYNGGEVLELKGMFLIGHFEQ